MIPIVIELESAESDSITIFKNQPIAVNEKGDLLVKSIVDTLAIRYFELKDRVLTYYSLSKKCYVAAAARPIHTDAFIPIEDLDEAGRITIKMIKQRFVVKLMKGQMQPENVIQLGEASSKDCHSPSGSFGNTQESQSIDDSMERILSKIEEVDDESDSNEPLLAHSHAQNSSRSATVSAKQSKMGGSDNGVNAYVSSNKSAGVFAEKNLAIGAKSQSSSAIDKFY